METRLGNAGYFFRESDPAPHEKPAFTLEDAHFAPTHFRLGSTINRVNNKGDSLLRNHRSTIHFEFTVIPTKNYTFIIGLLERLPNLDYQSVVSSLCKYEPK